MAPFSYQWSQNGTNLAGATSSLLVLTNVQSSNAGSYTVTITNQFGTALSSPATLTVIVPPTVTTPPQAKTLSVGQNVTVNVTATGTGPLSYQWRLNNAALAGATSAVLALTKVQTSDAGNYTVVVTNSAGSVTNPVARLMVIDPASFILSTAASQSTTKSGFSFQLSVPTGATYVILASTDLQNWTPIATNVATAGSVTFTDPAAANYPRRLYRAMVP